jgi:hypothetical protein
MKRYSYQALVPATLLLVFFFHSFRLAAQVSGTQPELILYKHNSGPGGSTPVVQGDKLGEIKFNALVAPSTVRTGVSIQSYATGPVNATNLPANLVFRTGAPNLVDRMVITSAGRVGIGTLNPGFNLHVVGNTHTTGDFFGRIHMDPNAGNPAPATYLEEAYFESKNAADIDPGLSQITNPAHGGLLTLAPSNNSGGTATDHQLFFNDGGIFHREGVANGFSWSGAWERLLTSSDISGTPNRVARFVGPGPVSSTLGNSQLFDDGTDVGIGTTTPDAAFLMTVNGDTRINGIAYVTHRLGINTNNPAEALDVKGHAWIAGSIGLGTTPSLANRLDVNGRAHVANDVIVDGNIGVGTATPTSPLHIVGESHLDGNVGIGTAPTGFRLDVSGDSRISGNVGIGTAPSGFRLDVSGTARITGNEQVGGNLGLGTAPSSFRLDVNGQSNFSDRVRIATSSFPTSADYELVVGGGIMAEEVRVNLQPWPDYVFADDYRLTPLAEVEQYIAANRHLPGVASARTVETEGLDLGQMQKAQMEKLEELFLHVIALEKRVKELEAQLQQAGK